MWNSITLWVLAAYIGLFVWQSLCQRQWLWLWLWGAWLLWLGGGVFGARLLPGVVGPDKLVNAYVPFAYITLASVLVWPAWRRGRDGYWSMQGSGYLALLAVSGVLQHLSFALLAVAVWWAYPGGLSLYVWPGLLQQYFLQPVAWIVCQWVLMAVFYLHRRMQGEAANRFSWPQLQAGFLLLLLLQVWLLLADLLGRFVPHP